MMTITFFFRCGENEKESCPSSIHCVKSIQRKELTSRRWLCLRCPEGDGALCLGCAKHLPAPRWFSLGVQSVSQPHSASALVKPSTCPDHFLMTAHFSFSSLPLSKSKLAWVTQLEDTCSHQQHGPCAQHIHRKARRNGSRCRPSILEGSVLLKPWCGAEDSGRKGTTLLLSCGSTGGRT